MPNNELIQQCKWCNKYYCANCSTHSGFVDYCSQKCQDKEDEIIRREMEDKKETKIRKARLGRNPKAGVPVAVPERRVVVFKAGKELKERVRNAL